MFPRRGCRCCRCQHDARAIGIGGPLEPAGSTVPRRAPWPRPVSPHGSDLSQHPSFPDPACSINGYHDPLGQPLRCPSSPNKARAVGDLWAPQGKVPKCYVPALPAVPLRPPPSHPTERSRCTPSPSTFCCPLRLMPCPASVRRADQCAAAAVIAPRVLQSVVCGRGRRYRRRACAP